MNAEGEEEESGLLAKIAVATGPPTGPIKGPPKLAAAGPTTVSGADNKGEPIGLADLAAGDAAEALGGAPRASPSEGKAASSTGLLGPGFGAKTIAVGGSPISEGARPEAGETARGVEGRKTSVEIGVILVRGADAGGFPAKATHV